MRMTKKQQARQVKDQLHQMAREILLVIRDVDAAIGRPKKTAALKERLYGITFLNTRVTLDLAAMVKRSRKPSRKRR